MTAFSTSLIVADGIVNINFLGQISLIALFSLLSFLLLLALVIFFCSFMKPMLAAFSALTVFVIGHITDDVRIFAQANDSSPFFRQFADAVYFAMPNFSILNLKNFVLSDIFLTPLQLTAAAAGALFWIIIAVTLGTLFFSRKEF